MAEVADITDVLLKSSNGQKLAAVLNTPSIVKHFKYLLVRKLSTLPALHLIPFRSPTNQLSVLRLGLSRLTSVNGTCFCLLLCRSLVKQKILSHLLRKCFLW